MKSKAIIFDIDSTAIDSPVQKQPTERLVRAAREIQKEYFLCAATGRAWSFAKPILQGMKLEDPCVVAAGTQIRNPKNGKILWESDIEASDMQEVIAIARQFPDCNVLINDNDEDDYLVQGGINPRQLNINGPVHFFEFVWVPVEVTPEIMKALSHLDGIAVTKVDSQRPGYHDVHVTNKFATKEHAIEELLKLISVKKEDSIGVGDGHNDLHLFNGVGHKVAVNNAVDDLKEKADEIIGDVSKDGFAEYLERLASANK